MEHPIPPLRHRLAVGVGAATLVVADVFTLGEQSAHGCARQVDAVRSSQDHWGSDEVRGAAWRVLVGESPPPPGPGASRHRTAVVVASGAEYEFVDTGVNLDDPAIEVRVNPFNAAGTASCAWM